MADVQVGKVTHYYDKIGVAVVEVSAPLAVGEEIKISGHDHEFTQKVESIQIEYKQIQEAEKGQVVGLKVTEPVKEHDLVYKVS